MKRRDFLLSGLRLSALGLLPFQSISACTNKAPEKALWPAARNSHASTFNHSENEMLIFGGSLQNGEDNELWSFKNNQWNKLSSSGPGKREDALLIHHTQNQKTYLIGGRSFASNTNYKDFWEWNGSIWTQLSNDTPFGNLTHAAATYDVKNNRLLVFGGASGSSLSKDLWVWTGNLWSKSSAIGPTARLASSLLYSHVHEKVYLFGGALSNGSVIKEVWELNGETWTKLNDHHPALLTNAYGVAPFGTNFILFGGFTETRQQGAETWIYVVHQNEWISAPLTPPTPRALHSMVYDSVNKRVLMFGGGAGGAMLDELWSFDGQAWSRIS